MKMRLQRVIYLAATIVATSPLLAQDTTQSFYFSRAVFGAGSVAALGTCNTGQDVVTEEMIFREASSGNMLHTETHVIPGSVCNVSVLQDGEELATGLIESRVTGPQGFQVISSLLMQLAIGEITTEAVRINPESPTLGFTVNFSEIPESRNGIAIVDVGGNGFVCTAFYRDGTLFGSPVEGSPVQAGPG